MSLKLVVFLGFLDLVDHHTYTSANGIVQAAHNISIRNEMEPLLPIHTSHESR